VATARYAWTRDERPVQFISLEDEQGLAEVSLFDGECLAVPYLTIGPYTATGVVEEQHGVFTVTARTFERWPDRIIWGTEREALEGIPRGIAV
jgi:hypothetical protein